MKQNYSIHDYVHFMKMFHNNKMRQKKWAKHFEAALKSKDYQLPYPTVIQLIPTEECNLRCPMCNQWGKKGYFLDGARQADHMSKEHLINFMRDLSPEDSLISIHGGEPFVYKYAFLLLELLQEKPYDVIISTNGTLIKRYLEPLKKIKNLALLLSVDGDRETHDRIRGEGRFDQLKEGLAALFEARRRASMPLPMVIMTITVCEWTTKILERAFEIAKQIGAFIINYNMRWFLSHENGVAYERHLYRYFHIKSTGAWKGFVAEIDERKYKEAALSLRSLISKNRFRFFSPYIKTIPNKLHGNDFETYFFNPQEVFGNNSCFMPFYWARILSNGDLIYCPGHPDIIAGNVFKDSLQKVFNSPLSIQFRKHILHHDFPICSRCCGLYMTWMGRPYEQKIRRRLRLKKKDCLCPL